MLTMIRNFVRGLGFEVCRNLAYVKSDPPLFELLVSHLALTTPDFYFVQVGANDGARYDPLSPLIQRLRLRGLLIEPLPDMFEQLKENYAEHPQLRFENCAIADTAGRLPLYRVKADVPDAPDWFHGLASFNKQHLTKFPVLRKNPQWIETMMVPTRPLMQVLAAHDCPPATLLQIDTEGYDYHVLKQALDGGMRPLMIHYEHVALTPTYTRLSQELLQQHGYGWVQVRDDTLAIHRSASTTGVAPAPAEAMSVTN